MTVLGFVIKSSIFGSMIYYSCHYGLWSNSERSTELYKKLYINAVPLVVNNVDEEFIKGVYRDLPSVTAISSFMKTSWNSGVMTSMEFISDLPTHTAKGANGLYESVKEYIKKIDL